MYGYRIFENGAVKQYGNFDVEDPALYQTDVLRQKAVASIEATAPSTPLFLSLMFVAPHGESVDPGSTTEPSIRPAPRDVGRFRHLKVTRAMRGELDVSDKPPYVRKLRRASSAEGRAHPRRLPLAARVADRGRRGGRGRRRRARAHRPARLDLHPLHLGQRLLPGRAQHRQGQVPRLRPVLARAAADPRPRHPRRARVSRELVTNADLAPTILEAAGAAADRPMDGRSLLPFARDGRLRTRRPVLHEGLEAGDIDRDGATRRAGRRVPRDPHVPLPLHRVDQRRDRALRPRARSGRAAVRPRRPPLRPDPPLAAPRARAPAHLRGRRVPPAARPVARLSAPAASGSDADSADAATRSPGRPRDAARHHRPARHRLRAVPGRPGPDQRLPVPRHAVREPDHADLAARRAREAARAHPRDG